MKKVLLNVRIPFDLRDELEILAKKNGSTISDTIRDILKCELITKNEYSKQNEDLDFYHSNEFLLLVAWVFEKKNCAYDAYSIQALLQLKRILIRISGNIIFPENLKQEFEKVLLDLIRYINTYHDSGNHFMFCKSNHANSFDYDLLSNFIYEKAFENKIFI